MPKHDWRDLKRHPLSAEYRDLKGKALKRLQESIKTFGFRPERPVTLYEGQVLDGWQRQTVCGELGVEPAYVELPDGTDPAAYVEAMNDARRHESAEIIDARAKARRKVIAEKRAAGLSTRQIAEEEGVSQTTVQRAIAAEGVEVEEVKGKDGRKHKGKRRTEPGGSVKVCKRCQTAGKAKDCAECKKLQKPKKKGGRPTYAWARFRDGLGTLMREIDTVGKLYNAKESPRAKEFRESLAAFEKEFKGWYAELTAQTPKG